MGGQVGGWVCVRWWVWFAKRLELLDGGFGWGWVVMRGRGCCVGGGLSKRLELLKMVGLGGWGVLLLLVLGGDSGVPKMVGLVG